MKKTDNQKEKNFLTVTKREVFGKKLGKLRKQGLVPANIYGEKFESTAVQVNFKDFVKTFKKAGETQIVYVKIEDQELPILIQNLQKHPLTNQLLHVDFRKVNLNKKIETEVPVKLIGESDAVLQSKGILLTISDSVLVEALPQEIPAEIEIDISILKELGDEILVSSLKPTGNFIFKDDPEKVIARISEHKEESIEVQVATPDAVEITTEKKEEETSEEKEETEKPEQKKE